MFVFVLASALMFVFAGNIGLKLVSAAALSVSCGLAGVPLAECVAACPRLLRERRLLATAMPAQSPRLQEQFDSLAATMHVRVKGRCRLKTVPGWMNACATMRVVVLGGTIAEDFGDEARTGVMAHELAHRKARHVPWLALICILASWSVALYVSLLHLPSLIYLLVVFSGSALVASSLSWCYEYRADAIAAQYVGAGPVIKGLQGFAELCGADSSRDSWSHPSLARRIARLEKLAG